MHRPPVEQGIFDSFKVQSALVEVLFRNPGKINQGNAAPTTVTGTSTL
jgi:hypothetical protein